MSRCFILIQRNVNNDYCSLSDDEQWCNFLIALTSHEVAMQIFFGAKFVNSLFLFAIEQQKLQNFSSNIFVLWGTLYFFRRISLYIRSFCNFIILQQFYAQKFINRLLLLAIKLQNFLSLPAYFTILSYSTSRRVSLLRLFTVTSSRH